MHGLSFPPKSWAKSLERILCMALGWSDFSHCAYCLWVVCPKVCLSRSVACSKPYASCHVCFNLSRLRSRLLLCQHCTLTYCIPFSELNTCSHRLKPPEIIASYTYNLFVYIFQLLPPVFFTIWYVWVCACRLKVYHIWTMKYSKTTYWQLCIYLGWAWASPTLAGLQRKEACVCLSVCVHILNWMNRYKGSCIFNLRATVGCRGSGILTHVNTMDPGHRKSKTQLMLTTIYMCVVQVVLRDKNFPY